MQDSDENGTKAEVASLLAELLRQKAGLLREYFSIDVDAGAAQHLHSPLSMYKARVVPPLAHFSTPQPNLQLSRLRLTLAADGRLASLPQLIEQYMPDLGESGGSG